MLSRTVGNYFPPKVCQLVPELSVQSVLSQHVVFDLVLGAFGHNLLACSYHQYGSKHAEICAQFHNFKESHEKPRTKCGFPGAKADAFQRTSRTSVSMSRSSCCLNKCAPNFCRQPLACVFAPRSKNQTSRHTCQRKSAEL